MYNFESNKKRVGRPQGKMGLLLSICLLGSVSQTSGQGSACCGREGWQVSREERQQGTVGLGTDALQIQAKRHMRMTEGQRGSREGRPLLKMPGSLLTLTAAHRGVTVM